MNKRSRLIVGYAFLGLIIAAAYYMDAVIRDYSKPMGAMATILWILSLVVCPPSLLFAWCLDCEVIGWTGVVIYSIIGVLNAALYAAVGAAVTAWRKQRES